MGLPWVRLDVAFASNPKLLALTQEKDGYRAAYAWLCSLAYAGQHGTDGFLPAEALPFLHARKTEASRLVDAGLWHEQPGGWVINGWDEFQQSNEETQQRKRRAEARNAARWAGHTPMTNAERTRKWRQNKRHRDDASEDAS